MKRRAFVHSTALATGSLFLLKCKAENTAQKIAQKTMKKVGNIGLQLWSVRHAMEKDPIGTLQQLSTIGFTDIECTGYSEGLYYGMPVAEFKNILSDLGMSMLSCHTKTGATTPDLTKTMVNNWEGFCEDNANMGARSVVCGYFYDEERTGIDDYKRHAELFNKCGEIANKYGLMFAHHNHDFEFFKFGDQVPYDVLLAETDPNYVKFELDHYWTTKANVNSLEYIKKHPGRFPIWHIKDMDDSKERFFTEVGSGVIDYPSIFAAEKEAGLKYFYVEQDEFKNYEPLESVKMSYDYLRKMSY